ncbi:MAG: hypothetical protein OEZ39_01065 [Gammaproteobacteria bacterium]|nr:hypothetical protein [Gammaproteobacteria bacterium]MDH5650441.1 hypothetical protein [Gammaproteobacteria bacterium]
MQIFYIQNNRLIRSFYILLLFCAGSSSTVMAASSIKCWTNKDNVRECGSVVPPEYSQQQIEEKNEQGMTVKVHKAAKNKEELEEEARKKAEEAKQAERRKRDKILLMTFTTERDLLISRETNLTAITGIINVSRGNANNLIQNLNKLRKKAGDYERGGKQAPDKLVQDMADIESQLEKLERAIKEKEQERAEMEKKFDEDLARFRELKKIRPR